MTIQQQYQFALAEIRKRKFNLIEKTKFAVLIPLVPIMRTYLQRNSIPFDNNIYSISIMFYLFIVRRNTIEPATITLIVTGAVTLISAIVKWIKERKNQTEQAGAATGTGGLLEKELLAGYDRTIEKIEDELADRTIDGLQRKLSNNIMYVLGFLVVLYVINK